MECKDSFIHFRDACLHHEAFVKKGLDCFQYPSSWAVSKIHNCTYMFSTDAGINYPCCEENCKLFSRGEEVIRDLSKL